MKRFAELCSLLFETSGPKYKELLLMNYLDSSGGDEVLCALYLLSGKKLPKLFSIPALWDILPELSGVPVWLIDESLRVSGDKAETISLILPEPQNAAPLGLPELVELCVELKRAEFHVRLEKAVNLLAKMNSHEKYIWIKLITGSFHSDISRKSIVNVLAGSILPDEISSYHFLDNLAPLGNGLNAVLSSYKRSRNNLKAYPFNQTEDAGAKSDFPGDLKDWLAEWKWDGLRVQLIYRNGELLLWTKNSELVTEKFPELYDVISYLPNGTVLDGEITAYKNGMPMQYNILQNRLLKTRQTKASISEAPAVFFVFDILEHKGQDIRNKELHERRKLLEALITHTGIQNMIYSSPLLELRSWKSLEELKNASAQNNCRGIILKRKDSLYNTPGSWKSLVIGPHAFLGVLHYVQRSSVSPLTEFTFAVWQKNELIPIAKTEVSLSDGEMNVIEGFVKTNTVERFGPVRVVKPELVFEIHFDGVFESKRRKSGIVLRNPRINRWYKDKKPAEADTIENMKKLLNETKA